MFSWKKKHLAMNVDKMVLLFVLFGFSVALAAELDVLADAENDVADDETDSQRWIPSTLSFFVDDPAS